MEQSDIRSIDELMASIAAEEDPDARRTLFVRTFHKVSAQNPGKGLELARAAHALMRSRRDRGGAAHALCCEGISWIYMDNSERAVPLLERALLLFEKLGDVRGELKALNHLGNAYSGLGRSAEVMKYQSRGLGIARELGDRKAEGIILRALGACHGDLGDYPKALEYMLESLTIFREIGDELWEGKVVAFIGVVYYALYQYKESIEYLHRALELQEDHPVDGERARLLVNLGIAYYTTGEMDRASFYLKEGVRICEGFDRFSHEAHGHGILGMIEYQRDNLAAAKEHLSKCLAAVDRVGPLEEIIEIIRAAGTVYFKLGEYNRALDYLLLALARAEEVGDPMLEYTFHFEIAVTYKLLGDFPLAVEHFEKSARIREEVMGEEIRRKIAEIKAKFDVAQAEKEKEVALLKAEQLEQEVNHKARELAALELNLKGREQLLEQLRTRIESGLNRKKEDPAMVLRELLREIETEKHARPNHRAYISRIDKMQEEFHRTLTQRYPTLTAAELKICSLLRGNLSTKEIADLLSVTTRNVETHRYHIRKKIDLPPNTSLPTFLASL